MKKLAKLLVLLLSLIALCFTATACGGSSDPQPTPSVDWDSVFIVNRTGETITGLTAYGKTLSKIEIPAAINGTAVTSIGKDAFDYCDSLTTVTFGDNSQLTSIGDSAFSSCASLTEIVIPEGVTSIGYSAFANCDSLTNIKVDANNATYKDIDGNLYSKDGTTLLQYANGKTATIFVFLDSVTSIGEGAFYSCDSLTEIVIPNGVTSIGSYAFSDCDSLTEIVIPNSVTSIGERAFYDCDSLTIYCKAASRPSGWDRDWNKKDLVGNNRLPVFWWGKTGA